MANNCGFELKVHGRAKDVKKFMEWMGARYHYPTDYNPEPAYCVISEDDRTPTEHHIGFRIFSFYCGDKFDYNDDDVIVSGGGGDCAWSFGGCALDGNYYVGTNNRAEYPYALSLEEACKLLNVTVEVWADECGCEFYEHYICDNEGCLTLEDTGDYEEMWYDEEEEYPSYDEFREEHYNEDTCYHFISEEEYNNFINGEGVDYISVLSIGVWLECAEYEFELDNYTTTA